MPARHPFRPLLALLVALLLAVAFAHDPLSASSLTVRGHDYAFEGPATLETGIVTLTFENAGDEVHHLQLVRLRDGVTLEGFQQAMRAAQQGSGTPIEEMLEFVGGVAQVAPGESATTTLFLDRPGTYLQVCFVPTAEGIPHLALGMLQPIEVVAAADTPHADVTVGMHEFAFDLPAELPAGEQVWEVVNHGEHLHELALARLDDGATPDDVRAYLAGPPDGGAFAAAPFTFVGGASSVGTDGHGLVHLDLEPGAYVALCYVPDSATRAPHHALGMLGFVNVGEVAE